MTSADAVTIQPLLCSGRVEQDYQRREYQQNLAKQNRLV
jgi:hypothetical protein